MKMKAISIRQPWAWLILHGGKDIENRTWATKYRGPVLIHAGKTIDQPAYHYVYGEYDIPPRDEIALGGFVGVATLVDCVSQHESCWWEGPYGFVLQAVKAFPRFIPYPGRVGLFEVDQQFSRRALRSLWEKNSKERNHGETTQEKGA